MTLTKFVIFTLAVSIAMPAFAADGAATYKRNALRAMARKVKARSDRP